MKRLFCLLSVLVMLLITVASSFAEEKAEEQDAQIVFDGAPYTLIRGQRIKLTYTLSGRKQTNKDKVTWSSSDETIAVVQSGNVTGKAPGTATVTCMICFEDGTELSADAQVIIVEPVKSVTPNVKGVTLFPGDSMDMNTLMTISPENATEKTLLWDSASPEIAMVDEGGMLTAAMPGAAKLTASTTDGTRKTAVISVTVSAFKTENEVYAITERTGLTVPVMYCGNNPEGVKVTAKGSATAALVMNDNGLGVYLQPTKEGEVQITLSDPSLKQNTYTFTAVVEKNASPAPVNYTPQEVMDNRDTIILYVGDTITSENNELLEAYYRYCVMEGKVQCWKLASYRGRKKQPVKIEAVEIEGKMVTAWKIREITYYADGDSMSFSRSNTPIYTFDFIDAEWSENTED